MTTMNKNNNKKKSNTPLWAMGGGGVLVALVLTVGATGGWFGGGGAEVGRVTTVKVDREDLTVGVSQPGQLEAANKEIVRCIPRGQHEIKWLIEEGATVKAGDVVVRLDTTEREERLLEQQQRADSAESAEVTARVNYENTLSQTKSDVEKAKLAVEFAELDLKKYLEATYPQELKSAEADVEIARATAERAEDKAEWSTRLAEKGYITDSEAEADIASARKARLDLEVAEGRLRVLQEYTFHQEKRRLESDLEQKRAELERVTKKAEADVYRAEIDWKTKKSNLDLVRRELARDKEDLENCIIHAPVAGRVVYAPQGNRWRQEEPLAAGQTVRHEQEIIHIPEAGAMSVAIKIDETQRDKVEAGMPVRITGPNLPRAGLTGTLERIAEYLDPSGWWNNNMKVYSATVRVNPEDLTADLRTGMNCQTEIIVAQYDDVLTLPLQAVTMVNEQHVVYVPTPDGLKPRPVKIGLDNGRKVHVLDGIDEGTEVALEPPLAPATRRQTNVNRKDKGGDDADEADDAAPAEQTETPPSAAPTTETDDDAAAETAKTAAATIAATTTETDG